MFCLFYRQCGCYLVLTIYDTAFLDVVDFLTARFSLVLSLLGQQETERGGLGTSRKLEILSQSHRVNTQKFSGDDIYLSNAAHKMQACLGILKKCRPSTNGMLPVTKTKNTRWSIILLSVLLRRLSSEQQKLHPRDLLQNTISTN